MSDYVPYDAARYPEGAFTAHLRDNSPITELAFGVVVLGGVLIVERALSFPPTEHFEKIKAANNSLSESKEDIATLHEAKQLLLPTDEVGDINDALRAKQSQLTTLTQQREALGNEQVTAAEVLALPAITSIVAGLWIARKLRKTAR